MSIRDSIFIKLNGCGQVWACEGYRGWEFWFGQAYEEQGNQRTVCREIYWKRIKGKPSFSILFTLKLIIEWSLSWNLHRSICKRQGSQYFHFYKKKIHNFYTLNLSALISFHWIELNYSFVLRWMRMSHEKSLILGQSGTQI